MTFPRTGEPGGDSEGMHGDPLRDHVTGEKDDAKAEEDS